MSPSPTTRTHLVTGAGSGMGAELADALAARGDRLVLLARSEQRAEEIGARFGTADVLVADLSAPETLSGLDLPESLDSLVHAAGVVELRDVAEQPLAALRQQLDVNLVAPAELTRLALPALRRARGSVVFVNSTSGLSSNPGWSAYAASKAGLRGFADALRGEEAGHGVRVTSVFPSRTATPMQQKVHEQEGRDYDASHWIDPHSVAATILHVLDLTPDATVPDVTVRPGPRDPRG